MNLTDYFWLNRAGRYANPLNSNDRLPIIYGDMTDGSKGNWILPCIDTVNFVYAFAGHETLSVANGNTVSIYKDGTLVPSGYTFNEANNYESEGTISTIDFTADQGNSIITARGKGKPTTSGGATLMTNIVDIANDFLTVENSFESSLFDATKKTIASNLFNSLGYVAAGAIAEDAEIWEILQRMMGSFYGSAYIDGNGYLCLEIDDGSISGKGIAAIFPRGDIAFRQANQKIANLITRCPASFAYNYASMEFRSHTDSDNQADTAKEAIYGRQEPASPIRMYWCRDLTTVNAIQNVIVGRYSEPIWELYFDDLTFKRCTIDVGDIFVATALPLYNKEGKRYKNWLWKTLSVRPDYRRNQISFRGLDLQAYLTESYLADGTYNSASSILAGGEQDITDY